MKKMFTKNFSVFKLSVLTGLVTGSLLLASSSYGQTYYSKFANPTGHYAKTDPDSCGAPPIQNAVGIADNGNNSYAYILDTSTAATYNNCSSRYLLDVDLNMNGGPNAVDSGNQAGFRIKIKPPVSKNVLGSYLTVTTFLRDSLNPNNVSNQEYATGGGTSGNTFYGVNLDPNSNGLSSDWIVYFTATKPFNLLELAIDPKIKAAGSGFEFDAYYAFGGAFSDTLDTIGVVPAHIANFKASVSGKNVTLSWQSLTETNVSSYRVERSSNNGLSYAPIATLPAKGNSSSILSYAYTDKAVVDGNYLYRIVVLDKDGSSKATGSLSAVIKGQNKLLVYPTIVKAGQSVTVKTSETGLVNVYMYDAQGRMVKQQRTASGGQFSIPTSGLSSGLYNIKVVSASGVVSQAKIVVN